MRVVDGPTAIFAVATIALLAALCFAQTRRSRIGIVAAAAVVALFVVANGIAAHQQRAFLRVAWMVTPTGPAPTPRPLYEQWNTHSRIRVYGYPNAAKSPFGWGLSPRLDPALQTRELNLEIDSGALTVLTAWNRDPASLAYLRYDITNLAHYVRRDADVLVIGAGGGRDLLSALAFGQRSVLGLEVNGAILELVNRRFGDFTGHLDRDPRVRFVNDEARSWVARSAERFDIIQISLIDSFAATAAGAFVLTENSLYTVEAWKTFLEHLKPGGILTVTRDYFADNPGSAYRMTALASAALAEIGVDSPRPHLALLHLALDAQVGMGTILVGRDPLSEGDLATLRQAAADLSFDAVLLPDFAADETFDRIAGGGDLGAFYAGLPLDVSPSTDDRPFFFHMLRLRDALDRSLWNEQGVANFNIRAVLLLGVLLLTVTALTLLFVIVPLLLRAPVGDLAAVRPWLLVFAGIGAGFMIVEISQMQRLIVFLGHPVYSLSVVLFTLLLASGAGSASTRRIPPDRLARSAQIRVALLLAALAVFGLVTPWAIAAAREATTPLRVLVSVLILAPIGFSMGMPLPISMQFASRSEATRNLTPWLWGINGATSVLASVIAVVIAMSAGITASFWVGFGCYAVAGAALLRAAR
jgi:spermidine synthase